MKKLCALMIFILTVFQFTGCGGDKSSAEITGPSAVRVGSEIILQAILTVRDNVSGNELAIDEGIEWKSSDPSIATVHDGVVTGVTEGYVNIKAVKSRNDKKIEAAITIRVIAQDEVLVHYFRYPPVPVPDDYQEGDEYANWGFHLWWCNEDGDWAENYFQKEGTEIQWTAPLMPEDKDDFGIVYIMDIPAGYENTTLKIIPHDAGDKDGGDRNFPQFSDHYEFWLVAGISEIFVHKPDVNLKKAVIVNETKISLEMLSTNGINENDFILEDNTGTSVAINGLEIVDNNNAEISADVSIYKAPFVISYMGRTISAGVNVTTIDNGFAYEGDDLGCIYNSDGSASLKLWAPFATHVSAYFYDKNDQTKEVGHVVLTSGEKGVWSAVINPSDLENAINETDLNGYFYQYEVTNNGEPKRVLDPYAKSMAEFTVDTAGDGGTGGDNVGKAAILDISGIGSVSNYAYSEDDAYYQQREDAIIYEIHIRDFTSDPNITTTAAFGTYKSFIERLPYIKSLGVTHIQLLPVQNYYYGNESSSVTQNFEGDYSTSVNNYNWGYDPHSYFSPEGMYSQNPSDPKARVEELKELIQAIHDQGLGVLLDVVYNHTSKVSILEDIVPGYYYRLNPDGSFKSQSGCGNDVATEHKMARKLIVESIKYWVEEYKVDGFRFDLMGLIDRETITAAYDASAALNPKTLFVGEGWFMNTGDIWADQGWQTTNNDIVSCFVDDIRDMIKGGGLSEDNIGLIENEAIEIFPLYKNLKGQVTQEDSRLEGDTTNTPFTTDDPGDCLQYIAAHDNLTLHDKIAYNLNLDPANPSDADEIYKRIKLGNFFILTAQGLSFLHGGQEMGRSKWFDTTNATPAGDFHENYQNVFVSNSYDSSDIINRIDWNRIENYGNSKNLINYTKGLIALRKSTDAFRLGSQHVVETNAFQMDSYDIAETDLVIAYKFAATNGIYFIMIVNADSNVRSLTFTENLEGTVIVDSDEAGVNAVSSLSGATITGNSVTMQPLTAIIIKKP